MTPDELDALYREHASETGREVARVLGESSLAEDCVHDVCLRLLKKEEEVTYKRQLLRVSAVNRARDMMRRRCSPWDKRSVSNDISAAADFLPSSDETMEDDLIESERQEKLADAIRVVLNQMPEALAAVMWLHHAEGLTVPAIAKQYGESESAIKMRLMRARDLFRVLTTGDPRERD